MRSHLLILVYLIIAASSFAQITDIEEINFNTLTPEFAITVISSFDKIDLEKYEKKYDYLLNDFSDPESVRKCFEDLETYFDRREEVILLERSNQELQKRILNVPFDVVSSLPPGPIGVGLDFIFEPIKNKLWENYPYKIGEDVLSESEHARDFFSSRLGCIDALGVDPMLLTEPEFNDKFINGFTNSKGQLLPSIIIEGNDVWNNSVSNSAYKLLHDKIDYLKILKITNDKLLSKELSKQFLKAQNLAKDLEGEVSSQLNLLGKDLGKLVVDYNSVLSIMDTISYRIDENEKKLEALTSSLDENNSLLYENSIQNNLIQNFLFGTLDIDAEITKIENDDKLNKEAKDKLLSSLKVLQSRQNDELTNFINKGNQYIKSSTQLYNDLVATGYLKGEDAKHVGEFIYYAAAVGQTATGISKITQHDYTGIFDAVGGIAKLTGKKSSDPSPEIKLMDEMFKSMNNSFNITWEKLEHINKNIIRLDSLVVELYLNQIQNFEEIDNKLSNLNYKIDQIYLLDKENYFKDYLYCENAIENFVTTHQHINYKDYAEITSSMSLCIGGISGLTFNYSPVSVSIETYKTPYNVAELDVLISEVYKPTLDFFKNYYRDNLKQASLSLLTPVKFIHDSYQPLFASFSLDPLTIPQTGKDDKFATPLNPNLILNLSYYIAAINPVFLFISDHDFDVLKFNEYLELSNSARKNLKIDQLTRLNNLLEYINYCIAQQTLLSGQSLMEPFYSTCFVGNNYNYHPKLIDSVNVILQNNSYASKNFSLYLLNQLYDIQDTSIYSSVYNRRNIDSLNIIRSNYIAKFELFENNVVLTWQNNNTIFKIPAPKPFDFSKQQFTYIPVLKNLFTAKDLILQRIHELDEIDNLNDFFSEQNLSSHDNDNLIKLLFVKSVLNNKTD